MDLFNYASELKYGELHLKVDPKIELRAIVAIHNLERGPAIGGCRFIEYDSTDDALQDAMRLARGMTYKAAISGLPHGGGKAVIVRPKGLTEAQREQIFAKFGAFVDSLAGQYITCEDSGTKVSDMNLIHEHTDHVLGYSAEHGGSGDPSPFTAFGVRRGIEAAVKHRYGRDELAGLHVAVQGVGHVGYYLARELHELGARLTVTDINEEAIDRCVDEFDAKVVAADSIFDVDCDIFAPCALGAILDDDTIARLKCDIVAGAANNQLAENRHGAMLVERDILYAPDYALNAGGLINVAQEFQGYDAEAAREKTSQIYDTMLTIFERAERDELPTAVVADSIVEEELYS
ncbi:MAG: Leu/Phe/Val dehydrogenase [Persicimonas sp.]